MGNKNTYFEREPVGTWARDVKDASLCEIKEALGPSLELLKTVPRDHQYRTIAITTAPRDGSTWLVASEMGSGKTKICIDTYTINRDRLGTAQKCLVLCMPVGPPHWRKEIAKHSDWTSAIVEGTPKQKLNTLLTAEEDFVLASTYWISRLLGLADKDENLREQLIERFAQFDMLVIDEAHHVAGADSLTFNRYARYLTTIPYRYLLTGTPIGNNYLYVFGLYYLIDSGVYGESYNKFLADWFDAHTVQKGQGWKAFQFTVYSLVKTVIIREEFFRRFWTRAVRWEEAELNDLPSKSYIQIPVTLSTEQRKAYQRLLDTPEAASDFNSIQYELMRVTAGCYPGLKSPGEKWEALKEIIQDHCIDGNKQLIIWHWLDDEGELLEREIGKLKPKLSFGAIRGLTTTATKRKYLDQWEAGDCQILIANPASLGTTVDLYQTYVAVYYSNSYSVIHRKQSEKRIHRDGQTHPVIYYDLVCSGTVDNLRLQTLMSKLEQFSLLTGDQQWSRIITEAKEL